MTEEENWNNATEASARHWDYLLSESLSAREVAELIRGDFALRRLSDVMRRAYPHADLEERLFASLREYCAKFGPEIKDDSLRRKIQNWLADRNQPTDREEVFRIAFALGLGENGADALLSYVFDQGIHYRNTREVVFAFYLKNGWSYGDAVKVCESLSEAPGAEAPEDAMLTRALHTEFEKLSRAVRFYAHIPIQNVSI